MRFENPIDQGGTAPFFPLTSPVYIKTGHIVCVGAGDEARTRDIKLGKLAFHH